MVAVSADIHRERQVIMAVLQGTVIEALDLKNKRVADLEKRFDKIDRQVMQAQRRALLVAQRKRV